MKTMLASRVFGTDARKKDWREHATGIASGTILLFTGIIAGYAVLFAAIRAEAIALPAGMLLSSFLLYLSFTVAHEAGHGNIAHEIGWMKPLERFMGWAATIPFMLVPFGLFARIHDYHHAFTNDPDRDPDFAVSSRLGLKVIPHALVIALMYLRLTGSRFARDPIIAQTHKSSAVYYLITLSILGTLIFNGYGREVLWIGILPLFIASFVLAMLFDWIPHTPASEQGRWRNTRTVLFPGLKYLTLGQNYHHIHHLYPRVPWYKYENVFEAIRPELEAKGATIDRLFESRDAKAHQSSDAEPRSDASNPLTLSVASIRKETPDSATITFANPAGRPMEFKAGQYITLSKRIEGETVTRCYSICESPYAGRLTVGVKRVAHGRLSTYLNDELKVGDKLTVAGPFGDFTYEPSARKGKSAGESLVLIAGGSGITPVLAILRAALEGSENAKVHLIYANRSRADEMFRKRLDELAATHAKRLKITRIYEEAHAGWKGAVGRIDARKLSSMLGRNRMSAKTRFYVCGPEPMKNTVIAGLRAKGVDRRRINIEEFVVAAPKAKGPAHKVEIALADGARHELEVAENRTVLQAAKERGVSIPHACGVGQCGCCMMRVTRGDWESASPDTPALLAGEKARGLTLACQCRPRSAMALTEGKG